MKRLTTYCFLLLAGLNAFFARYLAFAMPKCESAIRMMFEGKPLLFQEESAFLYPWWPWIGVVVCVVGAILSMLGKPKDSVLKNVLVVFLVLELCVMFLSMVTAHLPWLSVL